jgi:hypothetical protein
MAESSDRVARLLSANLGLKKDLRLDSGE